MKSHCLLGICLILAAGCTVGPDFRRPEARLPDLWAGANAPEASVAVSDPVTMVEWWRSFNDGILTSLVERAVRANPDLRLAGARIRQARAARGAGAADLWPGVDASASYTRSRSPGGPANGGGSGQDLFQAGLDAAWELDFFGGTRRNIEALDADWSAAVEDRRDVLVTLVSDVGLSYITLRGLQQQIVIAERNLEAQRRTVEITRKRFEAGFVSALDVANARALAATTASQIPVLESSARATIYSLGVLLGEEPTALVRELETKEPIPITPPEIPVGLPSDLLRRRPDIRRSEAQLHAATARIGAATADLFPRFSLTGSFGFSSTDLASFLSLSSRSWSIGPSVQWPVFDAGRIRWNIEVQNALQEQALITYEKTILTALSDVETALTAYAREQEHHRLIEEAAAQNRKALDLAMQLYTAGQTDFLNVLTAQQSLYSSEDALVQSARTLSTNLVALYKALGGGWENAEEPPA